MLSLSTSKGKDTELILQLTWHLFKHSTQFTHGREGFFFKGSKNVRIKTELCFFCAALHTHLVHNIQSGRFLRLKALSSAS